MTDRSVRLHRPDDGSAALPPASDAPTSEAVLAAEVDAVLLLLDQQERLAAEALNGTRAYSWPSWSMDTGLSAAEELFVETWPPQRLIEACRSERRVLHELQGWARTHPDDDSLGLALDIVRMLRLR